MVARPGTWFIKRSARWKMFARRLLTTYDACGVAAAALVGHVAHQILER